MMVYAPDAIVFSKIDARICHYNYCVNVIDLLFDLVMNKKEDLTQSITVFQLCM